MGTDELGDFRSIGMNAMRTAKKMGLLESGDVTVITAGDTVTSPMPAEHGVTAETPTNVIIIAEVM